MSSGSGIAPRYGISLPTTGMETLLGWTIMFARYGKVINVGISGSAEVFF